MRDVLRENPDFEMRQVLLQEDFADEDVAFAEGRCCRANHRPRVGDGS